MRVALKVYLTVERLMIEHDELGVMSPEEEQLINETCCHAWDLLTAEERAVLKLRNQPTREERNPTKIVFMGLHPCICGGSTFDAAPCRLCAGQGSSR